MLQVKTASATLKTASLISALWARKLPVILERLTILDHAAEAAEDGGLGETLCEMAVCEAHKLAGSLGTFGFPRGTEIARELELGLESGTLSPAQLRDLTQELRETLSAS